MQQSESATPIHISLLFWISFSFRSPQSIEYSSPCYIVDSHELPASYIVSIVYIHQSQSPNSSHPSFPTSCPYVDSCNLQFSSVAQSCPTLCDPMNCSTPGLPVHHHLPEFTQTHVHRVHDAIQPSHPGSSPSPPAPNPSQHQSFPMSQLFA